ncbi:MAG TPA: DUF924 family protein [Caulobacteraceae bacterium]|jgi:uncharacterized protein (DUF924 family)
MAANPADIIAFWRAAGPKKWFEKDAAFDEAIRLEFEPTHHAAARGEYDRWMASADGALALLLLLDQFPRNLYRGSGHAFATDGKARHIARASVAAGFDRAVEPAMRNFFYLPFEHSENAADQAEGVALCQGQDDETPGDSNLKWALIHQDIITRFGRFPHRNAALGRETAPVEQAFLDDGGFAG